jgi:hypothetical protein
VFELRLDPTYNIPPSRCFRELDRIEWAASMAFDSYGLAIGIRTNIPSVLSQIEKCLPPAWTPSQSTSVQMLYSFLVEPSSSPVRTRRNRVYALGERLTRTDDLPWALHLLEAHLQEFVAEHARDRVFVHAGVVGWNGRAIVIPGSSHSGKSTLVAALIRAGAVYYSDEFAVFDRDGRVHPYPRPLSLRERAGDVGTPFAPERFGATIGIGPLPVGLIVVTRYQAKSRWKPRRLSGGKAAMALFANALCARSRPEEAFAAVGSAAKDALAWNSVRGDAEDTARRLIHDLDAHPTGS